MARSTTTRNTKAVAVDTPKVATDSKEVATEKTGKATEKVETSVTESKKEEVAEVAKVEETKTTETKPEEKKTELKVEGKTPFKIGSDGLVEVLSEKRAGKTVVGTTGDIITFDEKGIAKVKIEDALHFAKIPGFSFK